MKILSNRGAIIQATTYSFIGTIVILAIGILSLYITDVSDIISLSSILKLFVGRPLLWILASFVVIIPLIIFLIYYNHSFELERINNYIEKENLKVTKIDDFVSRLMHEDFDSEFTLDDQEDKLGKSLIRLKDSMKSNKEIAEKRRKEDEIRNWTAEGMAKFGEILRSDNDNLEKLAYNVIKNLTDYIGAIQGGFYLLHSEDEKNKYFELTAFHAFGRKKYADQQLKWGKGIIGTCCIERKILYMTDLPDSYINVTSGLGKANPRSMIVSPLIANEELFGVFEIASLQEHEK
jgi:putative methionine-R-sulfoxide reductase with GAF domain